MCVEKGHSVSLPTLQKVSDFLLYLRKVKMSVSFSREYCSMFFSVFNFKLPEISEVYFKGFDLLF